MPPCACRHGIKAYTLTIERRVLAAAVAADSLFAAAVSAEFRAAAVAASASLAAAALTTTRLALAAAVAADSLAAATLASHARRSLAVAVAAESLAAAAAARRIGHRKRMAHAQQMYRRVCVVSQVVCAPRLDPYRTLGVYVLLIRRR